MDLVILINELALTFHLKTDVFKNTT